MPGKPRISDESNWKIVNLYQGNPSLTMKELTRLVSEGLKENDAPSESYVTKFIKEKVKTHAHPEDEPWRLTRTWKYPLITPEALPIIIQCWEYAREKRNVWFTYRDAQWVARLRFTTQEIPYLTKTALDFSYLEMLGEIMPKSTVDDSSLTLSLYEQITGVKLTKEIKHNIKDDENKTSFHERHFTERFLKQIGPERNKGGK